MGGSLATKANETFAIEGRNVALSKVSFQHIESCDLGTERGLAYIAHVVDMKIDELAEHFQSRNTRLARRLTAIDLALGIGCPVACIVVPREGLADLAALVADLARQEPDEILVSVAVLRVRPVCAEGSKRGEKRRILA